MGKSRALLVIGALFGVLLAGCGGGDKKSTTPPATTNVTTKGVVYPIVVDLSYQTNTSSGKVAADGSYTYKANENVTFSVGGIELATVPAGSKVTPLPLDSDVASTNLLRLLKALDTDGDLSNGITLPTLATSTLINLDLTDEASLAAALASLAPSATLPAANDPQVVSALADAKTIALQNMGTYGSTYTSMPHAPYAMPSVTPQPLYYPKSGTVTLTSPPDWLTGSMSGTATLTLYDNSQVTFAFNSMKGTYTALGITQAFTFAFTPYALTRVLYMDFGDSTCVNMLCSRISFRDNSQPNIPPIAGFDYRQSPITLPICFSCSSTHTWCSDWRATGSVILSSGDRDGYLTSVTLTSNKGTTETINLDVPTVPGPVCVSELYFAGEQSGVTVSVTDDEGASTTRTFGSSSPGSPSGVTVLQISGDISGALSASYDAANDVEYSAPPWQTGYIGNSYALFDGTNLISRGLPNGNYYITNEHERNWLSSNVGFGIAVYEDATTNISMVGFSAVGDLTGDGSSQSYAMNYCAIGFGQSCASAGVALDRVAGSITFTNTPICPSSGSSFCSGPTTINGTLTFTPF